MNLAMITVFGLSMMILGPAYGQSNSQSVITTQHQVALKHFSEKLQEEDLGVSDAGCPAGSLKHIEGNKVLSGSAMSADTNVALLNPLANALASTELAKLKVCGTCKQMAVATPYFVTTPAKVAPRAFCDNRPTVTFEDDFQSQKEGEEFVQRILKKKNQEGERLYAGCPDPCAYSVYSGKRVLANGKIRLTTTILCGQPRNSNILFAKYNYSYGAALQYTCKK